MADFCAECSIETIGFNTRDMAGQTTPEENEAGSFSAELCEGCGDMILVDYEGVRVTSYEVEKKIIDGEEFTRWVPRDEEELAAARKRVAEHSKTPEPETVSASKPSVPETPN